MEIDLNIGCIYYLPGMCHTNNKEKKKNPAMNPHANSAPY